MEQRFHSLSITINTLLELKVAKEEAERKKRENKRNYYTERKSLDHYHISLHLP